MNNLKYNTGDKVEKGLCVANLIVTDVGEIDFVQDLRVIEIKWVWEESFLLRRSGSGTTLLDQTSSTAICTYYSCGGHVDQSKSSIYPLWLICL